MIENPTIARGSRLVSKHRHVVPGYIYHVLNRGAQRQRLFFCDDDFADFETLLQRTLDWIPLPILTYELMPNHWHFVVQPEDKDQLSTFFQYVTGTHGKRFRASCGTIGEGHVYQDRFKSFPMESDAHFLTVNRYVERNALSASLVERAEDWKWGALWRRQRGCDAWLRSNWPVPRPDDWIVRVNTPLTAHELSALGRSIRRGTPFGSSTWVQETAERMGIEHTLRSVGRPRIVTPRFRDDS